MSKNKVVSFFDEFKIEEEEKEGEEEGEEGEEEDEEEGFEYFEEDVFPDICEEQIQSEQEEEGTVKQQEPEQEEKKIVLDKPTATIKLDAKAAAEIKRCHDPSYTNVNFPYYLICEKRLADKMKQFRVLLKSEVDKITTEQTSAFKSVRIRRLYKTGMGLPERIFLEHEKGYTYKERERLRFLMDKEVI